MRVAVTSADISAGVRKNTERCPVALALRTAVQAPVSVGDCTWVNIITGKRRFLPARVRDWIKDFDAQLPVQPFQFDLTDSML